MLVWFGLTSFRGVADCDRGAALSEGRREISDIGADAPVPLRSFKKAEKAGDDKSMRVKSVKRVFSAAISSFFARNSSASLVLAASSPSSCPMYSNHMSAEAHTVFATNSHTLSP